MYCAGRGHVFGEGWVLFGSCLGIGFDYGMVVGIVVGECDDIVVGMVGAVVGNLVVVGRLL